MSMEMGRTGARRGKWAPAIGLAAALAGGCATPIAYRPNVAVVDDLGVSEAKRRLSEVLALAIAPRITSVDVTNHAVRYRWHQTVHGPYGIPMGSVPHEGQVHFANVGQLQIYTNHWVFIWGPPGHLMDKILFQSHEEARLFADLVMSFRERRLRGEAGSY